MRGFFLQQPIFRLLTPIAIGAIAYLLILLVNNNILQLQAYFLGEELYFCLGLAVVVQEVCWLNLRPLLRLDAEEKLAQAIIRRCLLALLLVMLLMGLAIWYYYTETLGYKPALGEVLMFVGVFCFLAVLLLSLWVSYFLLNLDNKVSIEAEQRLKNHILADFNQFKQGINPDLLFESLETLIVCLHTNKDQADDLLDRLSTVYRYVLGSRKKELVPIAEELEVLQELLALFQLLPHRKIAWSTKLQQDGQLIPGTLLHIVELIIRTSIVMEDQALSLHMSTEDEHYVLRYRCMERLQNRLGNSRLTSLRQRYSVYTESAIRLVEDKGEKQIHIPILTVERS